MKNVDFRDPLTVVVDDVTFSREDIKTIHKGFVENEDKKGFGYCLELNSREFDIVVRLINDYVKMNKSSIDKSTRVIAKLMLKTLSRIELDH